MPFDTTDPRLSSSERGKVALEGQRADNMHGAITVPDFGRKTTQEEIAEKRKKKSGNSDEYVKSKALLIERIEEARRYVDKHLDRVTALIGVLLAGGALSDADLEILSNYRDVLRNYGIKLGRLLVQAQGMPTPDGLEQLWSTFGNLTQAFEIDRQKALSFVKGVFDGVKIGAQYTGKAIEYIGDSLLNLIQRNP